MNSGQRGISLLEVLCSLVITAVILLIVANYFYNQSQRYEQVSRATRQIQELASVSYEWQTAQSQTNFKGLSMNTLKAAGLLPEDSLVQQDPWGGAITLGPSDKNPNYLGILLPNTPEDACKNLRNRMASVAHEQSSSADCQKGGYYIIL